MTGDVRRNRGAGRSTAGSRRPARGRPEPRRRPARVAGQRSAVRRPQSEPQPVRRRFGLPALSLPRLPRLPRPARDRPPRPVPDTAGRPSSPGLTALLALLVVLAAAAVAWLAVELRAARASEAAADEAQVTAARYAEQLLSYHHARLDQDFAQARELVTAGFLREYQEATDVVREQAVEDRAVIEASVVASSVVDADGDEVRALLFVNQSTTTGDGSPSLDLNRVMLTLVQEDGRWLVSDLDAM
jgi:Mce-associated membrane protein